MIIAIDFDGTVVEHRYPFIGKEAPYVVECLKKLTKAGHKLILYTMRSSYQLGEAIDWFASRDIILWGLQYNPEQAGWSQSNKCYAHLYIDDAALGCPLITPEGFSTPVVDWKKAEEIILKKENKNE